MMENTVTSPTSSSPSAEDKILMSSSADKDNNKGVVHSFDCAICYESLMKPGPGLECFTFGKLLINVSQLPFLEREHIYREFSLVDQCFSDGKFDCDKIVSTICGHIFHSGCIREWFFMKRQDRNPKCPFCNRRTYYEECRIIHPLSCHPFGDDDEPSEQEEAPVTLNETEYSDISCTSSSWPSDDDSGDSEDNEDEIEEIGGAEAEELISQQEIIGFDENDEVLEEEHHEDVPAEEMHRFEIEDGYYEIEFISPNDRSNNNTDLTTQKCGNLTRMMEFIRKFDLVHVITLMNIYKVTSNHFQAKKQNFVDYCERIEENAEDEHLVNIDNLSFVPLGYDFVGIILIIGLFVLVGEKYAEVFTRNTSDISSHKIMHCFNFSMFAILCFLITHKIFS